MQNPIIDPILIHEIRRNDFLDKIKGPEVFLCFATPIERTLIFKAYFVPCVISLNSKVGKHKFN